MVNLEKYLTKYHLFSTDEKIFFKYFRNFAYIFEKYGKGIYSALRTKLSSNIFKLSPTFLRKNEMESILPWKNIASIYEIAQIFSDHLVTLRMNGLVVPQICMPLYPRVHDIQYSLLEMPLEFPYLCMPSIWDKRAITHKLILPSSSITWGKYVSIHKLSQLGDPMWFAFIIYKVRQICLYSQIVSVWGLRCVLPMLSHAVFHTCFRVEWR